ncbi:MAG TPA: DoxX family protein [Moraxellaceae bacterium]|nr:DoxX family protein [Moraxellaceae bacterium]
MEFFRNINRHVIGIVATPALNATLIIVARVLMAWIFIGAGLSKLGAGYAGTQGYMASVGLPGELLPLVILLEIGGGIALVLGFQARLAALALAIFSIVSAFMFHGATDQMQQIMFMKNLAMAGGLLAFTVFGAGRISMDGEQR